MEAWAKDLGQRFIYTRTALAGPASRDSYRGNHLHYELCFFLVRTHDLFFVLFFTREHWQGVRTISINTAVVLLLYAGLL